jgi:hypothetical protein
VIHTLTARTDSQHLQQTGLYTKISTLSLPFSKPLARPTRSYECPGTTWVTDFSTQHSFTTLSMYSPTVGVAGLSSSATFIVSTATGTYVRTIAVILCTFNPLLLSCPFSPVDSSMRAVRCPNSPSAIYYMLWLNTSKSYYSLCSM